LNLKQIEITDIMLCTRLRKQKNKVKTKKNVPRARGGLGRVYVYEWREGEEKKLPQASRVAMDGRAS
jgi:hypothetical protein